MAEMATRYLYIARHGEASSDESTLTENGRSQAILLGNRLSNTPISTIHHGPLPRATQTATLIAEQLNGIALTPSEVAGDYVPHVPDRGELPAECSDVLLRFLDQFTAEDRKRGSALAREALKQFTGPVEGDHERHELLVTHNFLVGWLVCHALDAPKWRWLGLNHGNAALTVIRYAPGWPSSILVFNDMRHRPSELRQTNFPDDLRM